MADTEQSEKAPTGQSEAGGQGEIPLGEMIETLRLELQSARERVAGKELAFRVEKVELELKVGVSKIAKGEGEIKFWVVNAKAGIEHSGESVHTFRLTLSPVTAGDKPVLVAADVTQAPSEP